MPSKRRVFSCQSCRRLKTRCEVVSGSARCVRCTKLRLECSLPSAATVAAQSDSTREGDRENTGDCHCAARLDAIEASLAEIKQLLRTQLNPTTPTEPEPEPLDEDLIAGDGKDEEEEEEDTPSESDNSTAIVPASDSSNRIAPIQVVREMKNIINGPITVHSNDHILEQLTEIGLSSTELTTALYRGFEQVTSRTPFVSDTDTVVLRDQHPLLFAVCLLMGIRTIPGLNGSELHNSLYSLSKNTLAKNMLNTPLEISTIHVMLAFSIWTLGSDFDGRYIDSWLLSGVTITHSMLSLDLSVAMDLGIREARERVRTWNLASLVHLKFAIGTGRPSVVEPEQMHHWVEATNHAGFDIVDKHLASELRLYLLLYNAVFRNQCTVAEIWTGIEDWRCRYLEEGDNALQFAYSCVTLIVARWELTKLHNDWDNSSFNPRIPTLINTAIHHAQRSLIEVMALCTTTALVKTSYDFLLGAYAGLTLVEYSSSLPDLQATYRLMESVQMQSKIPKMVEPVFTWATGVMRKKAGDQLKESARMAVHRVIQEEPSSDWIPSQLIDSLDPSLLGAGNYYGT